MNTIGRLEKEVYACDYLNLARRILPRVCEEVRQLLGAIAGPIGGSLEGCVHERTGTGVASRNPKTLDDCMKEAQLVNDRNIALKLALKELGRSGLNQRMGLNDKKEMSEKTQGKITNNPPMKQIALPVKPLVPILAKNNVSNKKEAPMKRLSDAEFRDRLDKGLCFRCNEKYAPGHQCKFREYRQLMLFITNEEEEMEEEEVTEREEPAEMKNVEVQEKAELSLNSLLGFSAKEQ